MFSQLPAPVQQQVKLYLDHNDFPAAKKLCEDWLQGHPQVVAQQS